MNNNYSGQNTYYAREVNIMYRIYAWMCGALALTAATAYYISINPAISTYIFNNTVLVIVLMLAQLGLAIVIGAFINRLNLATAILLFMLYAGLMGVTLSAIFLVYTLSSIFATFIVTSCMFGAMALYGYFTKADLTSIGSFTTMALIGLMVAMLVNIFLKSTAFDYLISIIGVFIFTLLTAYDVQKLKHITQELAADRQTMSKVAILGALTLYLDFINLFLFLLRIMGRKKE